MKSEGEDEVEQSLERMQMTRSSGNFSKGSDLESSKLVVRETLCLFLLTITK